MRKATVFAVTSLILIVAVFGCSRDKNQKDTRRVYVPDEKADVLPETTYRTSWALLIGINAYPNLPVQYQLNYAVNDVQELEQVLIKQYQFSESNITTLTNEQATYQKIKDAMGKLMNPEEVDYNDRVLVYFAGHGQTIQLPHGGEMGFILPYDAKVNMKDMDNPYSYYTTCLGMDELKHHSNMIPAKHVLFLIDVCYSGLAISTQRGLQRSIPYYLDTVAKLRVRQVITAGLKGEQTIEKSEWGHGAFTYKLLEALRTGVADENRDGVITALELASHLRNVVPQIAPQTPQFGYFEGEGEFLFLREGPPPSPPVIGEPPTRTVKYPLPPLRQLTPEEVISPGKSPTFTVNYLVKRTDFGDLILLENWIKEIGPVNLPSPRRDYSIHCFEALKPAQFAAESWSADSELVYVIAGASSVVHNQDRGFYYVPIYRWLFFYKRPNSKFLLVCIDPGPEITDWVTWTWRDESSKTDEDGRTKTYKDFAPIDVSQWKVDSFDALQTVLKDGAMPADSAIFLRMDDIQGRHIPVWFIAFHGTFKVNAVTGELAFSPLRVRFPEISKLLHGFRNDRGEEYEVYNRHVKIDPKWLKKLGFIEPPYEEYDFKVDFRTRCQLTLEVPEWTTYFYYENPIALIHGVPFEASTRRKLGSPLLAEAKLIRYTDEGLKVRETHYREDGTKAYEGTVTFDSGTGFKKEESAIHGTKKVEYYFLWPCSTSY